MQNKVAVVTGASSGFGYELSLLMAARGCTVLAVARRREKLDLLVKASDFIIPIVQDVTQPLTELGRVLKNYQVDILVNNAGGALGRDFIDVATKQDSEEMILKNLTSLVAVTQTVLPFINKSGGDILNVGSIAGYEYYAGGSIYCAVKAGVVALTKAWREEFLGKNIRVMGIHPGMAKTEFSLVRYKGDEQKANQVYAGKKPLVASDVAEAMMWMLDRPRHVSIESMVIMPTDQANAWKVHFNG